MTLAIFDLDNTLLNGDSDHAWGEFLADLGVVDAAEYRAKNDAFYDDYCPAANWIFSLTSVLCCRHSPIAPCKN